MKKNKENELENNNIVSRIFLLHIIPLLKTGYKRDLTQDDVYPTRKSDLSDELGDALERAWFEELNKSRKFDRRPRLRNALAKVFWFRYLICGLWVAVYYVILWPLIPYSLALFISYFSGTYNEDTYKWAHFYNFLLNASNILQTIIYNLTVLGHQIVGMQIKTAVCSLMYRKILRMNSKEISKTPPGHVVNLMSNDVGRFDLLCKDLNFVWQTPLVVIVTVYLVWNSINVAIFVVLSIVFIQVVLQSFLSKRQGKYRGDIAKKTDERVKVMNELVNGIQVIKMYVWENPFEKIVNTLRKTEIALITKTSLINGFSLSVSVFTERFILFIAIVVFISLGGEISSQITFSLLQYFNLLQMSCNILLPEGLTFINECMVSIRRIENFLAHEELPEVNNKNITNGVESNKPKEISCNDVTAGTLTITDVCASWNGTDRVLKNINLHVDGGKFYGIVGPLGCGKSSLFQAILGELRLSKGDITDHGSTISYGAQEPWLFVDTVRENILFGLPYDKEKYEQVVSACSLQTDFKQFPHRDKTVIGERGISLSGGQRSRISLARAVYRQADIYILDDPLSAVDTRVSKHLVNECINGYLKNKTRIVITHQFYHLKTADCVVIMKEGKVEACGNFHEVSDNPIFNELIKNEKSTEDENDYINKSTVIRRRALTNTSQLSSAEENFNDDIEDVKENVEFIEKGKVSATVYNVYFTSGNSWSLLIFCILSILVAQIITTASDLWLTHWMNSIESVKSPNITSVDKSLINNHRSNFYYIAVWISLIIGCSLITVERSLVFIWICMRSSIGLHQNMFSNILQAKMRFFDTNPSGRILNRFSKDMGVVDEILPRMMLYSIQIFMVMLGIIVMIAIVNPYMVIMSLLCALLMYLLTIVYLKTAQALKRLEGASRSPVFSHVTATMSGLATIRSFNAQRMLSRQFDGKQDKHTATWYLHLLTNAAFSVWLSLITSVYVVAVSYSFLFARNENTISGNVGLAISQALILVNMVQYGIKQATEVISQMISVERINQYTKLPKEYPLESLPAQKPPLDWPNNAGIVFKDVYLRYEDNGEPVLKNLNLVIESGWKVGVVGRTGAGKSSLIAALFRLAYLDGDIIVDDINTVDIGLWDLRKKISIIPQEPVLFTATLRYNLDPFDKYSDAEIWKVLHQVELKSNIKSLSMEVTAGGTNFSAGQRQLLCLARAILSHNKILVLDEATANVDPQTDSLIQKTIRSHFENRTVITVAHRLHTVADSDRILVMDGGKISQFGHPHLLLQQNGGDFLSMVEQLTQSAQEIIRQLAKESYAMQNL